MLKSKYPTSNSCLPERPNLVCLILLFFLLLGVRCTTTATATVLFPLLSLLSLYIESPLQTFGIVVRRLRESRLHVSTQPQACMWSVCEKASCS